MPPAEKLALSIIFLLLLCAGATLSAAQTEALLHSFSGSDSSTPVSGLIYDRATGSFYGATYEGGSNNSGTVFLLTPNGSGGSEGVIYNFQSDTDAHGPDYGLLPKL
jgi:uncharacterized repeat protein (TIGR03803 family)